MIKTMLDVYPGTIVHGDAGYSEVMQCPHGADYYSYIGQDLPDGIDPSDVVEVSDDEIYEIDCEACK